MRSIIFFTRKSIFLILIISLLVFNLKLSGQQNFPFTASPLTEKVDLSAKMVEGVGRFLLSETEKQKENRSKAWQFDFSSEKGFDQSISAQRHLLSKRLGVVEARVQSHIEILTNSKAAGLKAFKIELPKCTISAIHWQVLDGLSAEGILIQPKGKVTARVVMIPDADVTPEVLAGMQLSGHVGFAAAQQLANNGIEVIIPTLISRDSKYSGNKSLDMSTTLPHREWLYRQAYEVGRHVIGYELQKVFSAIDWFSSKNKIEGVNLKIGVAGHGEGGLLALYAATLDKRISSTLVSGYFDSREKLWEEPIYRNVFGLLTTFGDAELAVMAWPRKVTIEFAQGHKINHTSEEWARSGAAPEVITTPTPEVITTPTFEHSRAEWERAKSMVPILTNHLQWVASSTGTKAGDPFSTAALSEFVKGLNSKLVFLATPINTSTKNIDWVNTEDRQSRSVRNMESHIQRVMAVCHRTRDSTFWQTLKGTIDEQVSVKAEHRKSLGQVLGELPIPSIPANPKARLLEDNDLWTSYEITLDVYAPDVFAWGILLVPKGIKPGEKRPVVVCQHGLEGVPEDVITKDTTTNAYGYYKSFAAKLAEKGYVTFAPHNYYRGGDKFRVLQRMANPIGLTLFSGIVGQHRRIVEWLGQQSFVDASRIGFYGLSYGGKTAMRVPALVEGYALSICSADFNEWIVKNSTIDYPISYLFTGEYDMPEWDLGHTFSYAEMAGLIAPRPFMVERGLYDGVSIDEWVDFEYAKVRRHFVELGISDKTTIEHFNGPHTINGVGTFEFLDKFLK